MCSRCSIFLLAGLSPLALAATIEVSVELQAAHPAPFERTVVFVSTDAAGEVLDTWTVEMAFAEGVAHTVLAGASSAMDSLSAKTDFHLRTRIPCLPVNGEAEALFTGAAQLRGGDLNGDNVVDMRDFNRLRYHWFTEDDRADLTGNGATGQTDLDVLKSNWLQEGDAP